MIVFSEMRHNVTLQLAENLFDTSVKSLNVTAAAATRDQIELE